MANPSLDSVLRLVYGEAEAVPTGSPLPSPSPLSSALELVYGGNSAVEVGLTGQEYRERMREHGEPVLWLQAVATTSAVEGQAPRSTAQKVYLPVELDAAVRVFFYQLRDDMESAEFGLLRKGTSMLSCLPDEIFPARNDRFVATARSESSQVRFIPSGQSSDALPHSRIVQIDRVFVGGVEKSSGFALGEGSIGWTGAIPTQEVIVLYRYQPIYEWLGEGSRPGPMGADGIRLPLSGPVRLLSAREEKG